MTELLIFILQKLDKNLAPSFLIYELEQLFVMYPQRTLYMAGYRLYPGCPPAVSEPLGIQRRLQKSRYKYTTKTSLQ